MSDGFKYVLVKRGGPVKLSDAPVGLFLFNGTLALKTEYGPDCYIVESGEVFWGGTRNVTDLGALVVQPLLPTVSA